jgi:hypothetical protein
VGKWDFDTSSIFAHIDAFVQRCKDMLEVCWAQMQFAPEGELPVFGGTRGPEITKSLKDIQVSFQRLVVQLRSLKYSVLDVTATRWHDDYNSFKGGVKDLEVMMQVRLPPATGIQGDCGRGRVRGQVHCISGPCHPPQVGGGRFYFVKFQRKNAERYV